MKKYQSSALAWAAGLAAALIGNVGMAGSVGDLTRFTPGTPARASEVNDNFEALKGAVNDNNTRLGSVESGKQNRITGACPAGMAIASIGSDGSVACEQLKASSGVFSVAPESFRSTNESSYIFAASSSRSRCEYVSIEDFGGNFEGPETTRCAALVQLQLPEGADITGFTCLVRDMEPGAARMQATLYRTSSGILVPGVSEHLIAETAASTGSSTSSPQERLSADAGPGLLSRIVDNSNYFYRIRVTFHSNGTTQFDHLRSQLTLWGCAVKYDL